MRNFFLVFFCKKKKDPRGMTRVTTCFLVVASVLLTLLVSHTSQALCPSNGNTHTIYVTSNMGNNIWSFDTQGNYLGAVLNQRSFPKDVVVDKLRAMRFGPDGHMYVSSARGSYSRVFAVSGNGLLNGTMEVNCTRNYLFTVVEQDKENPFLDHPYDIAFHPATHDMYVANQNSVTVTRYKRSTADDTKASYGRKLAWKPAGNVKAATEVNESTASAMNAAAVPEKVPDNAGLFASSWSSAYSMSSVRGLTISPFLPRSLVEEGNSAGVFSVSNSSMMYYLLVCDATGNTVHVFNAETGERLFGINVPSPIQVMFPSRYYADNAETPFVRGNGAMVRRFEVPYIYVTSKDDGLAYMVRFGPHLTSATTNGQQRGTFAEEYIRAHRLYTINRPVPLHAASGIYENSARDILFIADRNGRRISSYASPFLTDFTGSYGPSPFLGPFAKNLPDQPEFIMSALLEHQENIPFCYELNSEGKFRYVALCTAASIWSVVFGVILVLVPLFIVFRQIQYCTRARERHNRRMHNEGGEGVSGDASAPLLGHQVPNYGSAAK
ncbi:hypothetical protein ABB37_05103 [Leptomonas pyrrhocoris]|uniref:Uncharacterized protein n=1 Tax=Leptomonas pyrrhocoris TaxID=157538 RepID=A0A0M9G147_LEPPY|nr:hypothetical protein ABB37_05103 [Leptomonas pyrrhocoris]KPA80103.1 hypothetical protein ABB37_05103 [Leptomonas pyrrhocoris]|eukprot:XP_015658542.1 hypothetical protein ABB37_05103 [Leptomonas pyrrhocoris]